MNLACDIAIVGGGLAGASLAIALAPLGYDIKVIEAVAFKSTDQPSYDDRTLALSHSSCRILSAMGLWDSLAADATAMRKIFVTELNRPGRVVLDAAELGLDEFGHVVEARRFGVAVTGRLAETENIEVICPASVEDIEIGEQGTVLSLNSPTGPDTLTARLVVAADGANSFIRNYLQIPTETRDYKQTAIICNVTPTLPHEGQAFECLTPTGPFAVLPHTGMRCGLVWSVATDEVTTLMELDDASFMAQAEHRFGTHLGAFLKIGRRSAYPLKLTRAKQDIRDRLVILGNAAHAIHPVGAQGFNLALRDVAVLAEILADDGQAGDTHHDPGDSRLLQQYSRWRQADQSSTIAWSDGITRLFAHPSMLVAGLRTAGFVAHALLPGLRRQVANKAMGYRGRVPRLALGEPLRFP
jgi:2-octaprenyl-6-methoxyphenol hydroxylase